ncbi:MAG: OmpA family protein [Byssovorax sp.]
MLDRRATALLAGLCSLLGATRASAQASTPPSAPLDRFEPSPAGDALFSVPSAGVAGDLRPAVGLTWTYAHDPLVLRTESGRTAPLAWVDHQMILHTQASLQLFRRVELDVDFPFTLAQGGTTGSIGGVNVVAPSGGTLNDVRAGARVLVLRQRGFVPNVALGFSVWFPTGDAESFAGAGSARYAPSLNVSAESRHLVWAFSFGRRFQHERAGQLLGSQVFLGIGAAFKWQKLQIGPELNFSLAAGDTVAPLSNDLASAELLLGARYGLGPFKLGLGAGPGLGQAIGTPSYRIFASVSWAIEAGAPPVKPVATGDGNGRDGTRSTTLPIAPPEPPVAAVPPDLDGDGVPDAEDQCPTVSGDASPQAFRRGCPADRDRDGVYDLDDRCPDVPGAPSDDPAKNGCPPDTDGDGIVDAKDACPAEKGNPTSDPKTNGCPDAVRIEGTQIIILQQVNFETARDEIKSESFGLLGQVAAVLTQHPEIARLAVDGHTDSRGAAKANTNLSQRRALAVVRWLTEHGIDARRLEARGFGPRRPIADNATDAGRARNRRVEFLIKKRTLLGEAGWKDGPVD